MKTYHVFFYAVIAMILTAGNMAKAKSYPELTLFVGEQTELMVRALLETELNDPMDFKGNYEFRRFFLKINALVGFDIEIATIQLVPELELVFQKEKVIEKPVS